MLNFPIIQSHYWTLFWELTRCDAKLREEGTVLGFFWTLLHPLVLFLVMHQMFGKWMGKMLPDYAFYLIVGIVQWTFFADATRSALRSLIAKSGMVKNFQFPREILVLSSIAVVLWAHLLELGVLLLFLLAVKGPPTVSWLYLPVLIVVEVLWTVGIGLFLSRWAVDYRDLDRIWAVLMQASFFVVPVFYPLQIIAESKRFWLMLNPLVHVMDGMRGCLLRDQVPPFWIILALVLGGGLLVVHALFWFRRNEGCVADTV